MTGIIILGSSGHAGVLADALRTGGKTSIRFAGPDDEAGLLASTPGDVLLVNGVGSVGNVARRRAVQEKFASAGFRFMTVIHPTAIMAADVEIAEGAQVMAGSILQPGVKLGIAAIVNTGAIVDHDGVVGSFAHIATGARLAGHVTIGDSAHVGAGATVIQGITIGARAVVGAGAVVVRNVDPGTVVIGIPARQKN